MYQWYYSKKENRFALKLQHNVMDLFRVDEVRTTMWEEHCLECAAPECYKTCANYLPRKDGRCKLFYNSISEFKNPTAPGGYGAHIKFRKWANLMSLVFQDYTTLEELQKKTNVYHKKSLIRRFIIKGFLPPNIIWKIIHWIERKARRKMRSANRSSKIEPDAFILHCYSYSDVSFKLIMEIYDKHTPKYRTSFEIKPGENLHLVSVDDFPQECWQFNNLVKIYPESNYEADIDFYWCDFVHGFFVDEELPKVKCVVWDLDNTLWDGVLTECEDTSKLKPRDGILSVIAELDSKGIVQSIASKNDYVPCWKRLTELNLSNYFLYPQINWGAKSDSIRIIANSLNIGIDTMVFFDDSIFEREEVLFNLPQVRAYDPSELHWVIKGSSFSVPITCESRNRRCMYMDEKHRKEDMRCLGATIIDFLSLCEIEIELIKVETTETVERCFELIQRTNQLNMSGKKYTCDDFENVLDKEKYTNYAVYCKDKYGAYGISCYIQYHLENSIVYVTEYAMSCRVAEKYIESALFTEILRRENCICGRINVKKTRKNQKLLSSFEHIGFVSLYEDEDGVIYEFSRELKNNHIVAVKDE